MKTLILSTLATLAWDLQQHISPLFTSDLRIPQFILDTRHPWLEENKKSLARLQNPTEALCSLDSELRPTDGTTETYTYPSDLFRYLEIDNNRAGVNRPGWRNAVLRLREMLACPAAMQDVESFNVRIYASDGSHGIGYPEMDNPPSELPNLFIEVLNSMPRLHKLEWNTFGKGDQVFRKAFTEANMNLPSVRYLNLGVFNEFFVGMCPGVEILDSGEFWSADWRRVNDENVRGKIFESTKSARNLTSFSMPGKWEISYLEALLEASPNLTTIKIHGDIEHRYSYYDRFDGTPGQLLKNYTDILARFPRLESLHLPDASGLGLRFDGGAGCGNAYFGPSGRKYGRSVSRQRAEATEVAGKIVLDRLPDLKVLKIGGTCANITRNEYGANATWSWTGRMTEWTYEIWPEKEGFDEEDAWYRSGSVFVDDDEDSLITD